MSPIQVFCKAGDFGIKMSSGFHSAPCSTRCTGLLLEGKGVGAEPGNIKPGLLIENSLESESAHVYVESRGEMILFLLLNSKITPLQNRR